MHTSFKALSTGSVPGAAWVAAFALAAATLPAHAAGKVEVSYVQPEQFTDAGTGARERERTLRALTRHFEQLARRLPDGQTLRVEVLDVDLAGFVRPFGVHELRVLRGGADWPHMTLRYTLASGCPQAAAGAKEACAGRTIKAGEDQLADLNYLFYRSGISDLGGELPYEKRMLDHWFGATFAAAQP